MCEKKLFEALGCPNRFYFNGYELGDDYLRIGTIIEKHIRPDAMECNGGLFGEASGYFIKNGLRFDIEYDDMVGIWIELKERQAESDASELRKWAEVIFNGLLDDTHIDSNCTEK